MEIFEEIKSRVSMRDVLEHYGIYPVRGTNIYRCPFHSDKKPSANIVKGTEYFHCFACQWSGDIFNVVEHFEKCNRKQSLRIIDDRFGLGLYRQLSHKEKLELDRKQKERERAKAEKLAWERFERKTLNDISDWLQIWEQVQTDTHITRGEYRKGTWADTKSQLFFQALKEQKWLNWLYDVICECQHEECEFDFVYGSDKNTILKLIQKGEIFI